MPQRRAGLAPLQTSGRGDGHYYGSTSEPGVAEAECERDPAARYANWYALPELPIARQYVLVTRATAF